MNIRNTQEVVMSMDRHSDFYGNRFNVELTHEIGSIPYVKDGFMDCPNVDTQD